MNMKLVFCAFLIIIVSTIVSAVNYGGDTVITTSISNTSVTFSVNASCDLALIEPLNISLYNCTTTACNASYLFYNLANSSFDSSEFCESVLLSNYNVTPESSYDNDNLSFNITCSKGNSSSTLTAYLSIFKNGVSFANDSQTVSNGVLTNIYSLDSYYTSKGEVWKGSFWCGDGSENTTKQNDSVTILNTVPVMISTNLTSPIYHNTTDVYGICSAYDGDNDALSTWNYNLYINGSIEANGTLIDNVVIYEFTQENSSSTSCSNNLCDGNDSSGVAVSGDYYFNYTRTDNYTDYDYNLVEDSSWSYYPGNFDKCWDYNSDVIQIRITNDSTKFYYQCKNSSGDWYTLEQGYNTATLYEEKLIITSNIYTTTSTLTLVDYSYQENASTACGSNACDGSWSTSDYVWLSAACAGSSLVEEYHNWSKISGKDGALFKYKTSESSGNVAIPDACYNQYDDYIKIHFYALGAEGEVNGWWCDDGTPGGYALYTETFADCDTIEEESTISMSFFEYAFYWINNVTPVRGQNWTLSCQSSDGSGLSGWINSSQVTISNLAPYINNVSINPSPANDSINLTCNYSAFEVDGDAITAYYNWTIDGVLSSVHSAILAANYTDAYDVVSCSVKVSDGLINSSWSSSVNVALGDATAPEISSVSLSASSGFVGNTYSIYIDCLDELSGLATNYPKVSYVDPDGVTQGNYTMTLVSGSQYGYSTAFGQVGTYNGFKFYCMDSQSNLATNFSNDLAFIAEESPTGGGPGGGGGGGAPPVIIEGINDSLVVLSTGYGGKIYDLTFYKGEKRTLVLIAESAHTSTLDDLKIECVNPSSASFCEFVSYEPSRFSLGSKEMIQIKMTVNLPADFEYGQAVSFESELSYLGSDNELLSDTVRTNILLSKSSFLRAWGSRFFQTYNLGLPIPKVLVWILAAGLLSLIIGLLGVGWSKETKVVVSVWIFFISFIGLSVADELILNVITKWFGV